MIINIPDTIVQEAIDAGIIQNSPSIHSAESRGSQVQRMTVHIGEYVCAIIAKELRSRKLIGYDPLTVKQSGQGNRGSNPKKQGPIC